MLTRPFSLWARLRRSAAPSLLLALSAFFVPAGARAQVTVDSPINVNFGSLAVGSTSASSTLNFTVAAGTKVNSISVLTLGTAGKDFVAASGGTCATGTYSAKTNCTVKVAFAPLVPGQRRGAVVFLDSSNNELAVAPLYGIGTGPQAIYQGAVPTSIGSGLSSPLGLTVDDVGNVYIADEDNARVLKVTPGGTLTNVGAGTTLSLLQPAAVAIDGAGNIYIADPGNNAVYKVPPAGEPTTVLSSATTASYFGIAIDGAGDLYVSDADNGTITKITPAGTQTTVTTTGLAFPYEIALDPANDLYIADLAANAVYKVTPGGTQTTVGSQPDNPNFLQPAGLALDAAGDLYVTAYGTGIIFQITPAGALNQLVNGLTYPVGVALDANANLYFTQDSVNLANKIDQADPPTLSFQTTQEGSTSSDSPQVVTLQNLGNGTLDFNSITYPNDFPEAMGLAGDCNSSTPVLTIGTCTLTIDFSPTGYSGSSPAMALSESVAVDSNSLNATTTQDVTVTGTETKNGQTIGFTPPTPVTYGVAPINLASYGSASSGLTVTFSVISGPGTVNGALLSITGMGSVVVQASQAGGSGYAPATPVQKTIAVNPGVLTVTATSTTRPYNTANPTFTYTITGFVNGDPGSVVTGTPTLTTTATMSSQAGVYPITPSQNTLAATNYTFSFTNGILTVTQATPPITWANPAAITYGTALGATQLNAGSTVQGTFVYSPVAGTVLTAATHTLSVTFTPSSNLDYTTATATATIVVNQATPVISWPTPAPIAYGTALSATQLDASSTAAGTFAYTPAAGTVPAVGTQTLSVTLTPTDTVDYTKATTTVQLTVNQAAPLITWTAPAAIAYGAALSSTQLDASSTVSGTFAYTPAAGTVLTAGNHTLSVTFTPTNTSEYSAETTSVSITVNQAKPVITWGTPAAIVYGTALGVAQLDASASVGGTFAYSPVSGTVLAAGSQTLSVTFTPTDSVDYSTATATVSLKVNQSTPAITWAAPSGIPYGTALSGTQLDASSTVAGTFSYSPAFGTVLTAGTHTLTATFTPTDATDYSTVMATVSLTVSQITPTINWANPAAINYGTALSATQLDANSTVAGTLVYTPAAGTVLTAGVHTLSVTLTPTDTTDYTSSTATAQLTVNQTTPVVTWPTPAAIAYGAALSGTQLDASTTVAGVFVYTPSSGTVLTAGTHTLSVTFTPTDTVDYATVTKTVSLTVNQAKPTIVWATPAAISYGTALSGTQLDATSTVAGTLVYSPASGTVLSAGSQTLSVTLTPADTTDYATATATVTLTVKQITPTLTWATPTAIGYGTALSATQLDATASVAGTFVYSPAAGAILTAGSQTLSVTFTPTNATDYATLTATVTLTVNKVTPAITWATPAPIYCCNPITSTQLDAATTVAGAFSYSRAAGSVLPPGSYAITTTFTPADTVDYNTATASVTLVINKGNPVIVWNAPAAITYGTALSSKQLDAESAYNGTFVYTPASGAVLQAGTQTLSVTLNPSSTTDYNSATATVSLKVNQATPVITWPTPAPVSAGTALSATQLDASSTVAGTIAYSPASGTVLPAGANTVTATFTPTDTIDYATVTATVTVTVSKTTPVITWPTPAPIFCCNPITATQLDATTTVAGAFSYSRALGLVLPPGSYPITATFTPTNAADYNSATASVTLVIEKGNPVIDWNPPAAITYGTALSSKQLDAESAYSGAFVYTPASGTILKAGTQTLSVILTPTAPNDYNSATATVPITVNQVTPVVTWAAPTAINYGTALSATQLNAAASAPGSFAYSPALGTVLTVGTQTLSVTFTPTDSVDFATVNSTVKLTVNKTTPVITWTTPVPMFCCNPITATQLDATTPVAGAFAYSRAIGLVLPPGSYPTTTTFTPTDTVDYNTATAGVTLVIQKGNPVIDWPSPAPITYGTALSSKQLDAESAYSGAFVYTPASGTILHAGTQTLSVTLTPTDPTDYNSATATVSLTVNQVIPVITWATPAAINYGTALSATQLNATTPLPGNFVYTPALGAVPTAGAQTLSVTFTPTDNVDYATVTSTMTLTVNKVTPTVTWATPAPIFCCTALSATQLNASANVAGAFTYNYPIGSVLPPKSWTLTAAFTPADTVDYNTAADSVTLVINKGTPVIVWNAPAAITYGAALSSKQLDAESAYSGTFAYIPPAGTVLQAGAQTLSVTLTPTSTTDYNSATSMVSLLVNRAVLAVAANNLSAAYGSAIPALTYALNGFVNGDTAATSTSGAPVLSTTATSVSLPGTYPVTPAAGTLAAANYSFAFTNGTLTITPLGTLATPTFSVAGGTYSAAQTVSIKEGMSGATIYYTTNGSTPTATTGTKYAGAITVSASETVNAIAVEAGYTQSAVATAAYTIN